MSYKFVYRSLHISPVRLGKSAYGSKPQKKVHWSEEARLLNNVQRALLHFDDLYGSVYAEKWPSLRLALLTPPKYVAIPNSFTGDVDSICQKLESFGAFSIEPLWKQHHEKFVKDRIAYNVARDLKRVSEMERTMESIASTKHAEEMDVLYKNSPMQKIPTSVDPDGTMMGGRRVLSDISQAVVEHVSVSKLKGIEDFQFDSEYYAAYNTNRTLSPEEQRNSPFTYTKQNNFTRLEFPPFLKPYTFEPGNASDFPSALRSSSSGFREYICVNGGSIVPIIALDLKPGVQVLDMCAGPGSKTLLSILTMTPGATFTCNDIESSRLLRVTRLLTEFLGPEYAKTVNYTKFNATNYPTDATFDRVLADVPCLNDRVSCTVVDNNIFKSKRTKERLNLVKVQQRILESSFKCLSKKPGSSCVYSTCSLSPVENDGAVMAALKETEVPNLAVDLMGLWNVLAPLQNTGLFFLTRTRFGYLIEPNVISNFGPMFVSRIVVLPSPHNLLEDDKKVSNDDNEVKSA